MRQLICRTAACVALAAFFASACSPPAELPEPDRVATRVAEELAIAATLTAAAPVRATPERPPTQEPTAPPIPTDTPEPPTPAAPSPTPEVDRVIPGAGNPNGLAGVIVLPGYTRPELDTPVFEESVAFHLSVYDPAFGSHNGAGINAVDITITDPNGEIVQQRTEQNPKYCGFSGGDDDQPCVVWVLAEHGDTWPNGQAVLFDACCYEVNMVVRAQDPDNDGANWRFEFIVHRP